MSFAYQGHQSTSSHHTKGKVGFCIAKHMGQGLDGPTGGLQTASLTHTRVHALTPLKAPLWDPVGTGDRRTDPSRRHEKRHLGWVLIIWCLRLQTMVWHPNSCNIKTAIVQCNEWRWDFTVQSGQRYWETPLAEAAVTAK